MIIFFKPIYFSFNTSKLPNSWGKTLVVLIPKKYFPQSVKDFRPISLCNVCYKMISKILANCLKLVLPFLIGPKKSGFSSGRSNFDNILAAQEIVHSIETHSNTPLG